VVKEYNSKGFLSAEETYKNGIKDGMQKEYYAYGNLRSELFFINGMKEGIEKIYYQDFRPARLWREETYKNGVRDGMCKEYNAGGILYRESFFINGKQEGIEKIYYPDGKKLSAERHFKNGKREGAEKWYFGNGKVKVELIYNDGNMEVGRDYYSSGRLKYESHYKNFKRISRVCYDENGNNSDCNLILMDEPKPYPQNLH
jgi:antitoxin component YwqK of YwqJK toxin-antitoxin module